MSKEQKSGKTVSELKEKPKDRYGVSNGKCAWCGIDAMDLPVEHFYEHDKSRSSQAAFSKDINSFSHEELLQALYWVWDIFDRSVTTFFLRGETAKQAFKKANLTGDGIYIGIRLNDWNSGGKRIVYGFAVPDDETEDTVRYTYKGVPIYLNLYPDDRCIVNPDTIFYMREYFNVPNTLKDFQEGFGE